ncbi:unnamed protein product [Cyprideis torosa]|uniref:AP-3 complex subunit delta Mu C-terminal domain-containing protein n=1 Tax=Cyprideis torosa TaxID=163714 RepID=A0A7R8ZK52_9CRUS|nr:unnamed protein product [Cyprideis torosa]CAG0883729.1 unnamed protein product [Cyprideis torosa]
MTTHVFLADFLFLIRRPPELIVNFLSGQAEEDAATIAGVLAEVSTGPGPSPMRELAKDGVLLVSYSLQVSPMENARFLLQLSFQNISPSGETIYAIQWDIEDSANVTVDRSIASGFSSTGLLASSEGNPMFFVPLSSPLGAQSRCSHPVVATLHVNCITVPQRLRGTLQYSLAATQPASWSSLPFRLPLPVSAFLLPVAPPAPLLDLLSSEELPHKTSCVVPLAGKQPRTSASFASLLQTISSEGRLGMVESVGNNGSFYGRTIQGHHIAVLVKCSSYWLPNCCFTNLISTHRLPEKVTMTIHWSALEFPMKNYRTNDGVVILLSKLKLLLDQLDDQVKFRSGVRSSALCPVRSLTE